MPLTGCGEMDVSTEKKAVVLGFLATWAEGSQRGEGVGAQDTRLVMACLLRPLLTHGCSLEMKHLTHLLIWVLFAVMF